MVSNNHVPATASLRKSLKRGLARQAIGIAERQQAELPAILAGLRSKRLGEKARLRLVKRLKTQEGVVRASMTPDLKTIVLVLRNVRDVVTRASGIDVFQESELVYTRVAVFGGRRFIKFAIDRIAFCAHAIERMVERTTCELSRLLDCVDREAVRVLRWIASEKVLHENGDCYLGAENGVWAGSLDMSEPEPDWGLVNIPGDQRMQIFSVRTFLGEAEMRPMVWFRWQESLKAEAMCT